MTRDEIEEVAKVAGKEAAISTLLALGIDAENPRETQADFIHLRWWREIMQSVTKAAIVAGVIAFCSTLGGLIYLGMQTTFKP